MAKRTITLSDRRPVVIDDDEWTIIARASDDCHDGQVRCQANRISEWNVRVRVRSNEVGQNGTNGLPTTIVSATYSYQSSWQNERNFQVRHGVLLPQGESDTAAICRAIKEVCGRMAACEHHGDDAARWSQLADECIADLPPEEL